MGFFSKKKEESVLPNNLFDRIGSAAAGIQFILHKKGLASMPSEPDICIWENCGYLLAELLNTRTINRADVIRFANKMRELYPQEDERQSRCFFWINDSCRFYNYWVEAMINNDHPLPDVIVYNLIHPSNNRKDFDAIPLFEMNMFHITEAYSVICGIISGYFFNKDEDIKSLPKGF